MLKIWDDKFYMAKHQPPYLNTKACFGREEDTIFFFYGITLKGNVSHHWAAYHAIPELSMEAKLRGLKHYIEHRLPPLPRGYVWSEPRLYAGSL